MRKQKRRLPQSTHALCMTRLCWRRLSDRVQLKPQRSQTLSIVNHEKPNDGRRVGLILTFDLHVLRLDMPPQMLCTDIR
jgi:hypothetical protein